MISTSRVKHGLIIFTTLFLLSADGGFAQAPSSAAQTVERLHAQFQEMQVREASLRERLTELDEDLKPENIERSMPRMGSTRPEELRAQRKRQLENEKASVVAQLREIDTSRERLTAAIRNAESAAYLESAQVTPQRLADEATITRAGAVPRWLKVPLVISMTLLLVVALIALVRR